MKISITTLGCKLNQAEETNLKNKLAKAGFLIVPSGKKTDLSIINCCSVTQVATRKSRQKINQAQKQGQVWLTGCIDEKIPGIKKIIPDKDKLYQEIIKNFNTNSESQKISLSRNRSFIKIQTGCDNFCTYCIIPYFRGKPKSVNPKEIINQILEKEKQGFKDIVLTGINVNKYNYRNTSLPGLTEQIIASTQIPRIRFGSIDPFLAEQKFVSLFKNERIMPHVHLSLQSGSDRILKLMNRKYTTKQYLELIKKFKKINPNILFTTDIITGFSGETEKDFNDTCDFVKKIDFLKIHVFPYSLRDGTPAAKFKNQISDKIKKDRSIKLRKISNDLQKTTRDRLIDQNVKILFEGKKNGYWFGFTPNYVRIRYKNNKNIQNMIDSIKLTNDNLSYIQ